MVKIYRFFEKSWLFMTFVLLIMVLVSYAEEEVLLAAPVLTKPVYNKRTKRSTGSALVSSSSESSVIFNELKINSAKYKIERLGYLYGDLTYFQYRDFFSKDQKGLNVYRYDIQDIRIDNDRISVSFLDYNENIVFGRKKSVGEFGYEKIYGKKRIENSMPKSDITDLRNMIDYVMDTHIVKTQLLYNLTKQKIMYQSETYSVPEMFLNLYDKVNDVYSLKIIYKLTSDINWYGREVCEKIYNVKGQKKDFFTEIDQNEICDDTGCKKMVLTGGKYQQRSNSENIIKYSQNNFNFTAPTNIYYKENSSTYSLRANYSQEMRKITIKKHLCPAVGDCDKDGILINKLLTKVNTTFMKLFKKNDNEIYLAIKEVPYTISEVTYLVIYDIKIGTNAKEVEIARIAITNDKNLCSIGQVDIKHIFLDYFIIVYPMLEVLKNSEIEVNHYWIVSVISHAVGDSTIKTLRTQILDHMTVSLNKNITNPLYDINCIFSEEYLVFNKYQILAFPLLKSTSPFNNTNLQTAQNLLNEVFYFLVSQKITNSADRQNISFIVSRLESDLSHMEFSSNTFSTLQKENLVGFSIDNFYRTIAFDLNVILSIRNRFIDLSTNVHIISLITDSWNGIFEKFVVNIVNPKTKKSLYSVSGSNYQENINTKNFTIQFYRDGLFYNFESDTLCGEISLSNHIIYEKLEYNSKNILHTVCAFAMKEINTTLSTYKMIKIEYGFGKRVPTLYVYIKTSPTSLVFTYTTNSQIQQISLNFVDGMKYNINETDIFFIVNDFIPMTAFRFSDSNTKNQRLSYSIVYENEEFKTKKNRRESSTFYNFIVSKYMCNSLIKITGYKYTSSGFLRNIEKKYEISILADDVLLAPKATFPSKTKADNIHQIEFFLRDYFEILPTTITKNYKPMIYMLDGQFVSEIQKIFIKYINIETDEQNLSIKFNFDEKIVLTETQTIKFYFGYVTVLCGYEDYVVVDLVINSNVITSEPVLKAPVSISQTSP